MTTPRTTARALHLPDMPAFETGSVWLVGAGPGDPGLLSLLALHALSEADAVIYDALVSAEILALARPGAVLHYAGKRGGKPSAKQPDIIRELIALAGAGNRVLRLKGGDPFVFGRGGEEALALAAAGIPFRLVPGITAAAGALAYAGIPLTHRSVNSAVTFATGHDSAGAAPDSLDWQAVANGAPVLIFYMALKNLATIVDRLLESGLAADTRVAMLSKATTPEQRVLESTLHRVVDDVHDAGLEAPCIVVIGEVVQLRAALDPQASVQERAAAADALLSRWHREVG